MIDLARLKLTLMSQLGKPYLYGAKWKLDDPDPKGQVDCSGFVRWAFAQVGVPIPDGSEAQYETSIPVSPANFPDVGFFKNGSQPCHHVGILLDDKIVIEARGDPFNKIILRPRSKWEAWHEFTGWRSFKAVEEAHAPLGVL